MAPALPSVEEVCRSEAPYVVRVLRYFGVAEKDVPDTAQEVFLVVHRKLGEFEQRSSLRTWLYRICQRAASDYRKRAHVRREVVTGEPLGQEIVDGVGAVEGAEARSLLMNALARLDDEKRAVFVLFEIEGLEMKEVAEVVGCPLQTAYSRLHAARRILADAIVSAERGVA